MPNIFGPGDPPSSAGIAAGSEVQGPGGGSPAVGVNLAANTSPHHTLAGLYILDYIRYRILGVGILYSEAETARGYSKRKNVP